MMTKSDVSHVALGAELFGEQVLIHAAINSKTGHTGVMITPRAEWFEDNDLIEEYEIVPDVSANMGPLIKLLGSKYDKLGLFGYGIVIIARWLGKRIMNPFSSPTSGLICPQYVLKLDPTGILIPEWKGLDPDNVTPHDLLLICRIGTSFKPVQR